MFDSVILCFDKQESVILSLFGQYRFSAKKHWAQDESTDGIAFGVQKNRGHSWKNEDGIKL